MQRETARTGAFSAVAGPFLLSRLLVWAILLVSVLVRAVPPDVNSKAWAFTVHRVAVVPALRAAVEGGDSTSYVEVARAGYHGEITRVYPPAFPMLLRAAAAFTGEFWLTACVLNSVLMLVGLWALFRLSRLAGLDDAGARRAVALCCVFPMSYFLSLPFAEALLFCCSTLALMLAMEGRWWLAGLFGAVASATKVPGSLILIPLLILYWQRFGWRIRREIVPVLLSPAGMAGYLIYLRLHGTMDFHASQQEFGHRGVGLFFVPIVEYLRHPNVFSAWNFYPMHFLAMVVMFAAGWILVRRRQAALGFYALAVILLPLAATETLASLTRYCVPCAALYVALAYLPERWYRIFFAGSVLLFAAFALLYALRFGMAMA